MHGIPGRYASALYTAAAKTGKLDEVQDELTEVQLATCCSCCMRYVPILPILPSTRLALQVYNLTTTSPEFDQFVNDPSIPKSKKIPAMDAILEKLEVNEVTKHFFGTA